ncbi:TPA: HAD family hydrolase [Staphylococcus aureus]|nr:HAD family hydrolase [Staphylococcus aureus]
MKKILFDVDGVFLSEERCFDVSALTVYELLMDKCYLGLHLHIDWETLTDNDIQDIRNRIFQKDKILNKLKSLGLNSNWDMLFIVFSIHLIDILKKLSHDEIEAFMYQDEPVELKLQNISTNLADCFNLNEQLPLQFLDNVKVGKNNIYAALEEFATTELHVSDATLFSLKGALWTLAHEVYQEWYLGSKLYEEVEKKIARTTFKTGYIYQEIILRPVDEVKVLLNDLKGAGFELGIATGRPYTETVVPFENLGLLPYFEADFIATASDVLEAENMYPQARPLGKSNPFSYIAALYGNNRDKYESYINKQDNIVNKDDVFIVGDSLADLLSAQKIGATFIGTLTGLKGKDAAGELEAHHADYVINHLGELRGVLDNL